MQENRHCTYQHRLVKDDSLICVGHGTISRAKSGSGRNKAWKAITKDNQWYYLIVKDKISKDEAEAIEMQMIEMYSPVGNTRKCSLKALPIDQEEASKLFYYDETSPSCLRWKINRLHKKIGDVAGYAKKFKDGIRYSVNVCGKARLVHRVIWCLCKGENPSEIIDHIDGNPSNNKISNLRCVTSFENNRNRGLKTTHPIGYSGVSLTRDNSYKVTWNESAVKNTKIFSCAKYGDELALALALEYRYRMLKKQEQLGQEYSERHTGIYVRHRALDNVTEDELQSMFKCNLSSSNSSGARRVQRIVKPNGNVFWIYKSKIKGVHEARTFAVSKYGESLARNLAIEFSRRKHGSPESNVDGYSLSDTNLLLQDTLPSRNTSGITGLKFKTSETSGLIVVANKTINYKNYRKTFYVRKMGLLEAIAAAICWHRDFTV